RRHTRFSRDWSSDVCSSDLERAGCSEALFTLGDKPELRYRAAREALDRLGHATTVSYLAEMAGAVARETGLLPHLNPGVMGAGRSEERRVGEEGRTRGAAQE